MRSSFGALNTATVALAAQKVAIDTTSHNIANANTPGFSRQDAIFETTDPYTVPTVNRAALAGQLGTGVDVTSIRRLRDTFLDSQIRQQSASLGEQEALRNMAEQIEVVFNEPSDGGLSSAMSRFFNAWQAVANRPDDRAARAGLTVEAASLASMIQRNDAQLNDIRLDSNRQLQLKTQEINSLAGRIAGLNNQIAQVEGVGQQPNDLRDQRDLLVDQMSKLAKVSQAENPNGSINLFIGSRAIVLGDAALPLTTGLNGNGDTTVLWAGDNAPVTLVSGELRGLMTARDSLLTTQRAALDTLAAGLISQVNAVHATGYGLTDAVAPNRAFFTGTGASTIAVNGAVAADPNLVAAASAPNEPGNNTVALSIARLRDGLTMSGATATFHTYYQSFTASLGTESRQAATAAGNQQVLIDLLDRRKQAVAGVNLDEEAANLIRFQHAYSAAARVVTTVDEMLDRVINRMGHVGLA